MNVEQELLLLSLVNARYITSDLIWTFQANGFASFDVFSLLFSLVLSLLPPEYQGQVGYNALSDNAQYHPYIFPCSAPFPC